MRIAIVPSWYDSQKTISRAGFIRSQAKALAKRGHAVTVIVPDRDAAYPLLRVRQSIEDGMKHLRIALPWPWHRVLGFYQPSIIAKVLKRIIDSEGAQIVHAHAVRPGGVLTSLALSKKDIPWCLTEHAGIHRGFWWTSHGRKQIRVCYESAPRLFAVSQVLRREMLSFFPKAASHCEVISNGIDTDLFRFRSDISRKGNLLFVGALDINKGLILLIKALSLLGRPDVTLTVVGSGPFKTKFKEYAAQLRVGRQITWYGPAHYAVVPELYAAHDAVVVPSLYESFSMVCAEALACGRPVVATRCGGPEEVVPEYGGALIPVGDAGALAHAIDEVLSGRSAFDPLLSVKWVQERFSLTHLADRLEAVYREMAG